MHRYWSFYLDIGAGKGRTAEHVLVKLFKTVDLVEPTENLMTQAKTRLEQKNQGNLILMSISPTNTILGIQKRNCFWESGRTL